MLKIWCPAKINLFLSVGEREESGFHPIRTVFQAIGLFDTLTISLGSGASEITSDWADLPASNTVEKTLRLVADVATLPALRVHLAKRIPAQSGLGGGSSDAAGLLRGIRWQFPRLVSDGACVEVARAVGADVPFFLVGGLARGEGYGERLTPLEDPHERWAVVVKPEIDCDTSAAYERLDERRRKLREFPADGALDNDFEAVAPRECVEAIAALRAAGCAEAGLTGSGSAVFGICESYEVARRCQAGINVASKTRTWIAKTLSGAESLRLESDDNR